MTALESRDGVAALLTRIRLMVEEAEEEEGPVFLPSKGKTLLGAVCEEIAALRTPATTGEGDRMRDALQAAKCAMDHMQSALRANDISPSKDQWISAATAFAAIEAALAALPPGSGWQPIETAPMDGTHVLIWQRGAFVPAVAIFSVPDGEGPPVWWNGDDRYYRDPTHWQPLPPPPSRAGDL